MTATQEINIDTITPLVNNQIEDSATFAEDPVQVAAITEQPTSTDTNATSDSSSGGWLGWVGIGLSLAVGIFAWKVSERLTNEIKKLKERLSDNEADLSHKLDKIDTFSDDVESFRRSLNSISLQSSSRIEPIVGQGNHRNITHETVKPIKHKTQFKYATLQSPDENGVLRFSERSMVDSSSPQKMFLLEIDSESGSGTYRINPTAINLILADLQMFRDFVKPFTFSGNPLSASVQDKIPGKIIRKGSYWVVEEPLEISIH